MRARWDAFEAELAAEARGMEAQALAADRHAVFATFMESALDRYLRQAERLVRELAA